MCLESTPNTNENKQAHVLASAKFLKRMRPEGNKFLAKMIMGDETWINLYDLETKQESAIWKWSAYPSAVKTKDRLIHRSVMFIIFFDEHGMLLVHAVSKG